MSTSTVRDTFSRTLASGWGTADTGEAWTTFGAGGGTVNASDWSVGGGVGTHSVPATTTYRASYVAAFSAPDVLVTVTASVGVMPAGGALELGNLMLRGTDLNTYYLARVQVETSGTVTAKIFDRSGATLGAATTPLTYTPGMKLRVTAMCAGRTLRIRVSNAAAAEPPAWTLVVVDAGANAYTGAGWVGVRSGVANGNTNTLPVVFSCDDFTASVTQLTPFPTAPLTGTIEFAFGADLKADPSTWVWTDCTTDWSAGKDLAATIGRADTTGKAQPGKLSFWLRNANGDYTKGNPLSQYWPYIRKNTPVRVVLDLGTGSARQYVMYASQWIPRWGSSGDSGRQPLVQVVCNGVRRRLTQGSSPLRSPLYRAIAGSNPIAWWPLEDGQDSTQAASGLVGGTPMAVATGVMKFVGDGPAGATGSAQPDVTAVNSLNGAIVGGSATAWQVSVWTKGVRTDPPGDSYYVAAEVRTDNGKIYRLIVQRYTGASTAGWAYYASESATDATNFITEPSKLTIDTGWHLLQATMTQSGSNTIASFYLDGSLVGTQTWTGLTMGRPVRASAIGNFTPGTADISLRMKEIYISAIAVHNTATLVNQWQAGLAYVGETVVDRLTRLCGEEGVPITIVGTSTQTMGPQKPGQFVALLDDGQDVDGGILLDGLSPGFTYICRTMAENLPVAVTIDMAGRQLKAPFEPLDDDSSIVNDETISRTGGSSDRYVDQTSIDAIARYDSSATLNVFRDIDLYDQAAWRVHLGTASADVLRFPGIGFNLHETGGSALIEPWLQAGVRKRIQAINPPAEYGPGPIDLLIEGYTETVRSRRAWAVAAGTSPYDPWLVFVLDQDRLDADPSSQLVANVAQGAASFAVSTAAIPGALWTTDPAQFPLDVQVGGIRVRVTNIVGATSPQTFTVDAATVTKLLKAGTYVGLWQPRALGL